MAIFARTPSTTPRRSNRASSKGASRRSKGGSAPRRSSIPARSTDAGGWSSARRSSSIVLSTGTEVRYQIVGDVEADIARSLISISSPLARALIGKEEGDTVTVVAPDGEIEYEILSVAYL